MTKKITIADVGCTVEYLLHGDTLTQTDTGGCRDGLNDDGCVVDDEMDDDEIADAVRECWVDGCSAFMGSEYDPGINSLRVTVEPVANE